MDVVRAILARRVWHRVKRVALLVCLTVLAGCGSALITVRGANVACRAVPIDDCRNVADLGINNLAYSGPPIGVISVDARAACPPQVPDWADPSRCWNVHLPIQGLVVCMVVARGFDGHFGQAGGDEMTGRFGAAPPTGVCP